MSNSVDTAGQDKGKTKVATGENGGKIADIAENRGKPGMPQRWFTPPTGWIKVNTDAAFCYDSGAASVGIIIRDSAGKVLLSTWQMLRGCASLEQAEAKACLRGLRLVLEWIREPAWVETDYLTLIKGLEKGSIPHFRMMRLLTKIRAVEIFLPDCKFRHINRGPTR
jgi:hypothetical protein